MALFQLNWTLEGFRDKVFHAGEVIEADIEEVAHLVAEKFGGALKSVEHAVLSPFEGDAPAASDAPAADGSLAGTDSAPAVPGGDVNLDKLTKAQLADHAAEHHDITLDPAAQNKADMVQVIVNARELAANPAASDAPAADGSLAGTAE